MSEVQAAAAGDDESVEATSRVVAAAAVARQRYEQVWGLYNDFARSVSSVLTDCLANAEIVLNSITYRAKSPESFERKAARPSPKNPTEAKYANPFREITDKAGVRVITYFQDTVRAVSEIIVEQFDVVERVQKVTSEPDRLGYQSVHYLVQFNDTRTVLPEYLPYKGMTAEIQVRTILQHAWAEIEHDIQYKAIGALPVAVRRRFAALAGLVEIADREFQAIQDEDERIRAEARQQVDLGQLDQVEITSDSLREYLDRKLGPDGRMKDWSYRWTAQLLLGLGFTTLAQVDECIAPYDDDRVSRALHGARQGQISRFEDVLLVAMGEGFIEKHPFNYVDNDWFVNSAHRKLGQLESRGISAGAYRPNGKRQSEDEDDAPPAA